MSTAWYNESSDFGGSAGDDGAGVLNDTVVTGLELKDLDKKKLWLDRDEAAIARVNSYGKGYLYLGQANVIECRMVECFRLFGSIVDLITLAPPYANTQYKFVPVKGARPIRAAVLMETRAESVHEYAMGVSDRTVRGLIYVPVDAALKAEKPTAAQKAVCAVISAPAAAI
jgi:hypothetical protein